MRHASVLLKESIDGLDIKVGDVFVDGTIGSAGHSEEVCKRFGTQVTIVGIDMDEEALERSENFLKKRACRFSLHHGNFSSISQILDRQNLHADKILLDLGISSHQLDESGRGFTFQKNEPLLMTMKKRTKEEDVTAGDIVNSWDEVNLADIIYGYGEERFARRIAKGIIEARANRKIENTHELAEIIKNSVPSFYRKGKIHPATKTFQAIRIAVNDELQSLEKGLTESWNVLKGGGRIAVISFHSLEDRIVKKFFKKIREEEKGKLINKKPITPTQEEIKQNPRSRSAKLRIAEKL